MRRLAVNKDGKLDYTEGKTKRQNPVAKHSKNMPGAGAHKSAKDYDRKKAKLDLKKELEEGGFSASKSALVKAVLNDLEKKALSDDADNLTFLNKLARMIGKKVFMCNFFTRPKGPCTGSGTRASVIGPVRR